MALLFMDGFGGADGGYKWDVLSDSLSVSSGAQARVTGGYAGNGSTISLQKTIPASTKVIVGFGVKTMTNAVTTFYGDAGATPHITVMRNQSTGLLEIRRGTSGGTLLATGTQPLASSQWNYIESSVTVSDTVGEVHVRLNGMTTDEASYTGDTKNGGTATTIDKVGYVSSNGGLPQYVADVYILNDTGPAPNNNFLGDVTVRTLSPSGNGTYSQLTGSDGNQVDNYLLVDDHPYSGTDYAGSATVGQKDAYAITDLPAGTSTIYGVQISGMMAKSDASLASARYLLRSGGTDYPGTTRALTTTYSGYYELYETNPATGLTWIPAGVNAVEAGMEVM